MKKIPLRNKQREIICYAIVDNEDFEWLNKNRWYKDLDGYAYCSEYIVGIKKWIHHSMALDIMRFYDYYDYNKIVDHMNLDKLDNRKFNLRMATKSQSAMHRGIFKNNTSGYKGVYYDKRLIKNPWYSKIQCDNKSVSLGYFRTKEEAAQAYNNAALEYHGEFVVCNQIMIER